MPPLNLRSLLFAKNLYIFIWASLLLIYSYVSAGSSHINKLFDLRLPKNIWHFTLVNFPLHLTSLVWYSSFLSTNFLFLSTAPPSATSTKCSPKPRDSRAVLKFKLNLFPYPSFFYLYTLASQLTWFYWPRAFEFFLFVLRCLMSDREGSFAALPG